MNYVPAVADDPADIAACQKLFHDFARQTAKGTPLYSRLAAGIAEDQRLAGLLLHAPVAQRLPVLLFACVHWLLLGEPAARLARYYPNIAGQNVGGASALSGDPFPAFAEFCAERASVLHELLATRRTQTNEIGRTALFVPVFGLIERELGSLSQVDVGASAGLNLLMSHFDFTYQPGGSIRTGSTVHLTCGTRGDVPVPSTHPSIGAAIGIDQSPIDLADVEQARWLEACVWPDQVERFERLRSAIGIARRVGVDVRTADAVHGVALAATQAAHAGHPVLTTSWVMNYLSAGERIAFIAELDGLAAGGTDCSWVYAESPALCPELPGTPQASSTDQPTAVVVVRWRAGRRTAEHVADAHPHGAWMHWKSGSGQPGTTA